MRNPLANLARDKQRSKSLPDLREKNLDYPEEWFAGTGETGSQPSVQEDVLHQATEEESMEMQYVQEVADFLEDDRVLGLDSGNWIYLTKEETRGTKVILPRVCECLGLIVEFEDGSVLVYHKFQRDSVKSLEDVLNFAREKGGKPVQISINGGATNGVVFPRKGKRIRVLRGLLDRQAIGGIPKILEAEKSQQIGSFVYDENSPERSPRLHFPPDMSFYIHQDCLLEMRRFLNKNQLPLIGEENEGYRKMLEDMIGQSQDRILALGSDEKRGVTWVFDVDNIKELQAYRNKREIELAMKRVFGEEMKDCKVYRGYTQSALDMIVKFNPLSPVSCLNVYGGGKITREFFSALTPVVPAAFETRIERRGSDTSIENGWERRGKFKLGAARTSDMREVPQRWRRKVGAAKSAAQAEPKRL